MAEDLSCLCAGTKNLVITLSISAKNFVALIFNKTLHKHFTDNQSILMSTQKKGHSGSHTNHTSC